MVTTMTTESAPWLLTPGPLSTASEVRSAMLRDWGSWDSDFRDLTATVRERLLALIGAPDTRDNAVPDDEAYECVPIQGSGTFVMEALLGSFVPVDSKSLVLSNGAYGQRIATTLGYLGREHLVLDKGDYLPPRGAEVGALLDANPGISHVIVVHCETSSGILNPLAEIAEVVRERGCKLLIDSMSALGALPLDCRELDFEAVASSANKCIEGVPGFGFVLCRRSALIESAGRSHSLALDLHEQWSYMEKTGQWRFTPPTHSLAAFSAALDLHAAEGGAPGRLARYQRNCEALVSAMRAAGFVTLLDEPWLSPIIVTFFNPADPAFQFDRFYALLKQCGFIIYPGKLTVVDSFRMGCIGAFDQDVMRAAAEAATQALTEMSVASAAPSAAALQERNKLLAPRA
ncbi:MAG: 2-aminoethylphosphonate--pyruvate transaminase [Gammaproteobacteria bacterium]|nr:2-aminoethylphosphonate--pyruvate transaminase [Gammaproteobacteria bacterium]